MHPQTTTPSPARDRARRDDRRPGLGRATVLGYPRIGRRREVKRAVERYWSGDLDRAALLAAAAEERRRAWTTLRDAGMTSIPVGTFSLYDHVLDAAVTVGAVPRRFRDAGPAQSIDTSPAPSLDASFAMARGTDREPPLEMTKWFDTNYHYLVPEVGPTTPLSAHPGRLLAEVDQARALGVAGPRPVLVGPFTLLALAKPCADAPAGFDPLERLDDLVEVYAELLGRLHAHGVHWVQLDEPALVRDLAPPQLAEVTRTYQRLGSLADRPQLLVATYFGHPGDALPALAAAPVEALGVDLVAGTTPEQLAAVPALRDTTLVAGVVDGRNVWRTDLAAALARLAVLRGLAREVVVSTSCSLLHVPYDLRDETDLAPDLRSWLAFADEKVAEVALLGRGLAEGRPLVAEQVEATRRALQARATAPQVASAGVRQRVGALGAESRHRPDYRQRAAAQDARLRLPPLPTTTIGSFPQTPELRRARASWRDGSLDGKGYRARIREEVRRVVALQEELGLDVLVHGEPERNDMVQYFAEQLDGFAVTRHGWVQSYGSRCVKPPVLFGDVARAAPMTVEWSSYAQSLTERPVKAMLTGPVTILAWSFVRDDQPLADTARQVALAIRDEVRDLEAAGLAVIQVDEPALRELLPLRAADRPDYLVWAVDAFRVATSGVADATQVHTHLCYSEFGEILDAIDALDADVTSIEAARSRMELLPQLTAAGLRRGVGPGVYDIHSPRVPTQDEVADLLRAALSAVPPDRLWVNPDCGLKTRGYDEVEPALRHLVAAARAVRTEQVTPGGEGPAAARGAGVAAPLGSEAAAAPDGVER